MTQTKTLTQNYRVQDFPEKRLFIIEGPAGCGKSTLVGDVSQKNPDAYFPIVQMSLKQRHFKEADQVIYLSSGNDNNKLLLGIKHLAVHQAVIVDRAIASQWVYHQIRLGKPLDDSPVPDIDDFTQKYLIHLSQDLVFRGLKPYMTNLDFHFVFLLPPVENLIKMRANGSKDYPNDPISESFFYTKLAKFTVNKSPNQHLILSNPQSYFKDLISWELNGVRPFIRKSLEDS